MCDTVGIHRGSYKYWAKRSKLINPEKVFLLSEVRATHFESQGSAGARTIAKMVTTRGMPLSRYREGKLIKQLEFVSCQMPTHRYKKRGF